MPGWRAIQWLCLFLAVLSLHLLAGCAKDQHKVFFDIPTGPATRTLREFARQADVELLFDREIVEGVTTRAVHGNFRPRDALEGMLSDTPLKCDVDKQTGAFAVVLKVPGPGILLSNKNSTGNH